jgi:Ser/Thr protein kinase RdoA (MazF antagonist)
MDRFDELPESERFERYVRLAQKALSAYGLSRARVVHLGGTMHATLDVTTGDPSRHYILRVCPSDQSIDALERETLWLVALARDTDLVVPEPILAHDGHLIRKVAAAGVPGFRPCVLLRWVDGDSLGEELAVERIRRIGRLVAALHAHAETFRWPEEITPPRRNATLMSEVLDDELLRTRYAASEIDVFRQAIDLVTETMVTLRDGPSVAGVIHGDLRRRNLLFQEDRVGVVGFDQCRWEYYAYDLAVLRSWLGRREGGAELYAALLEGYLARRDPPRRIEQDVTVFSALRSIDRVQAILSASGPDPKGRAARELNDEFETLRSTVAAASRP